MNRIPLPSALRSHPRVVDAFIVVVAFGVAFYLRFVNYSAIVAYPDEFTYTYRALTTIGLGWAWSKQFMLDQPPIYMYALSVLTTLVNGQLDTFRMFSVICGSLTVPFVYLLGKSMFNRRVGAIAAFFFAFNGLDILYSRLTQEEALTILFMTISLYLFWSGVVEHKDWKRAAVGGLFLGLAIDTKYAALILPVTYVLYVLWSWRDWSRFRVLKTEGWNLLLSKPLLVHLIVGFLVFLPIILILQINGVNALYWDLLGKFVRGYSPFYRTFSIQDVILHALSSYSQVVSFVSPFNPDSVFPNYEIYLDLTLVSLLLVLGYFVRAFIWRHGPEVFLAMLFGVSALVFLVYPGRFQYYQLYTFPAYPLMVARLLDRSAFHIGPWTRSIVRSAKVVPLALVVLLSLVISLGFIGGTASAIAGHGAQDDLLPFFQQVKAQGSPQVIIAVTPISGASFVSYYLAKLNVSARIVELSGIGFATDPPVVRILEAPIMTNQTLSLVVTLAPLSVFHPQYVVLGQAEYQGTFTTAMKLALLQDYRPLMTSPGFIIFERFPQG